MQCHIMRWIVEKGCDFGGVESYDSCDDLRFDLNIHDRHACSAVPRPQTRAEAAELHGNIGYTLGVKHADIS